MLKNVKIRTRLLFGFGVVLILLIGVSVFSIYQMTILANYTTQMYNHSMTTGNAIREADINIIKMGRMMKDVALAENAEQLELAVENVNALEKEVFVQLENVRKSTLRDPKILEQLRQNFANWKPIRDEVVALSRLKEREKAGAITKTRGSKYIAALEEEIKSFTDFSTTQAANYKAEAKKNEIRSYWIVGVTVFLAVLISLLIAYLITISITRPINIAMSIAEKMSKGEISPDMTDYSQDEMGQMLRSLKDMAATLREQMRELTQGISVLSTSAAEISSTTAQFATTTQEVATSVNEVVVSMKEVKQTTELSNEKSKEMSERAKNVVQISRNGESAVQQTIAAINTIQEQMMSIADSVVGLSDKSQSIGEIIAAVDDVADQSRLLAVNASIEAVKAGEQGKGFSVVAEEIKNLSLQSKQSTSQVRTILTDIQKATSAAVMATEKGSKAVEGGVNQAGQTGSAIRTLGENVTQTSQSAVQIEASSRQQVAGIDQVFSAMESINNAISQNAAGARQLEQSAVNLNELGKKLKAIVEKYRV